MTHHGGKRPGAERPKGAKAVKATSNKKSRQQIVEIVERALENDDVTPLKAMLENLAVISAQANKLLQEGVPLTDQKHMSLRKLLMDAAQGLAPYLHPRLSAIASVSTTAPADAAPDHSATDEFMARIQRLAVSQ